MKLIIIIFQIYLKIMFETINCNKIKQMKDKHISFKIIQK